MRVAHSVFSGWTGRSADTSESTWSSVMETSPVLNRSHTSTSTASFITQHAAMTTFPGASVKADERLATVVRISLPPLPVRFQDASRKTWVITP